MLVLHEQPGEYCHSSACTLRVVPPDVLVSLFQPNHPPQAHTVAMCKFGAMAPDGRSRAFDASAAGYVRGEGGGRVVLKLFSRALADGDPIYAVIRGSALNNNGFSNGLTAPNPKAQE